MGASVGADVSVAAAETGAVSSCNGASGIPC